MDGIEVRAVQAAVVAFLIAATLILVLRPLAAALKLVDEPGGRKTHNGRVPIVGGVAILGALTITSWFSAALGHVEIVILGAAAFLALVGLLDDRFELPSNVRLFAQVVASIALVFGTKHMVADLGDLFTFGGVRLGWLALPFTVTACVALVNAFNMLDGFDGLAGGVALSACVVRRVLGSAASVDATRIRARRLAR